MLKISFVTYDIYGLYVCICIFISISEELEKIGLDIKNRTICYVKVHIKYKRGAPKGHFKKKCRLKINGHKIIRRQILYYKHKAGIAVLTPMADSCQYGKNHQVIVK